MILNILFQTFVWGVLSDKYQKRRTLIILGEMSAAISTFFVWFLHTLPASTRTAGYVIIIGLSVVEIFWSMSNVGWSALISDLYPEHQRASIQGKLSSIGAVGMFVGVWIGGLLYDGLARFYEGWGFDTGMLFFIASGVMAVSTVPMFFVPEGGIGASEKNKNSVPELRHQHEKLFSYSKKFLIFLLAIVFINFGRNCIAVIKSQYFVLDEGFNVSSKLLSYIVNMESVAIFIVGLFIGKLSKRLNDWLLLLLGSLIAIGPLLGFALARTLTVIFVSNFLAGVSMVVILASSYSYASKLIPPAQRGKQFALFNATLFLSWGVGATVIAGPIVDLLLRSGATEVFSYKMSFIAAAVLVLIGVFILLFVKRIDHEVPKAKSKKPVDIDLTSSYDSIE